MTFDERCPACNFDLSLIDSSKDGIGSTSLSTKDTVLNCSACNVELHENPNVRLRKLQTKLWLAMLTALMIYLYVDHAPLKMVVLALAAGIGAGVVLTQRKLVVPQDSQDAKKYALYMNIFVCAYFAILVAQHLVGYRINGAFLLWIGFVYMGGLTYFAMRLKKERSEQTEPRWVQKFLA